MVLKLINATDAKVGTNIIVDGVACTVKKMDVSKTGKHGHAKVRIEAVGIIDGKKRVIARPGHERFEVPMVNKKKAVRVDMTAQQKLEVLIYFLNNGMNVHRPKLIS